MSMLRVQLILPDKKSITQALLSLVILPAGAPLKLRGLMLRVKAHTGRMLGAQTVFALAHLQAVLHQALQVAQAHLAPLQALAVHLRAARAALLQVALALQALHLVVS